MAAESSFNMPKIPENIRERTKELFYAMTGSTLDEAVEFADKSDNDNDARDVLIAGTLAMVAALAEKIK